MARDAALLTPKGGLGLSVRTHTVPTYTARLRGVSRVYKVHRHAYPGCFVGYVHSKLVEGPGMPFVAIFAAGIAVSLAQCVRYAIHEIWKKQPNPTTQNQEKRHISAIEDYILIVSRSKTSDVIKGTLDSNVDGEKIIQSGLLLLGKNIRSNTSKKSAQKIENTAIRDEYETDWQSFKHLEGSAFGVVSMIGACFKSITSMVEGRKNASEWSPWIATTRTCFSLPKSTKSSALIAIRLSGMKRKREGNTANLLSNPCEVFESKCLARYDDFSYQGFRYLVIHVSLKAFLAPREVFETTFRGAGNDPLQFTTALKIAHTHCVDLSTCKGLPFRVGGKVHHVQVNAQRIACLCLFWCVFVLFHVQVGDPTPPYEVSTAILPLWVYQHVMLPFPWQQPTGDTSLDSIERHTIKGKQAESANIVAYCATRSPLWTRDKVIGRRAGFLLLACSLDRFHGLRTSTHSKLSPQSETGTSLTIDTVVCRVGIANTLIPVDTGYPRSRCIEMPLRLSQGGFVPAYIEFNADSSYERLVHKRGKAQVYEPVKVLLCPHPKKGRPAPPLLKSEGVRRSGFDEQSWLGYL